MQICFFPIGIVRNSLSDEEVRRARRGVRGYIEVFKEYMDGLDGIEEFSHIMIIAYLHKVSWERRKVLKVRPRGRMDLPLIGVFSTNSPLRPNPIAVTIVRLLDRRGNILYVDGLDLFDGTPVLDIKPYTPGRIIRDATFPEWIHKL